MRNLLFTSAAILALSAGAAMARQCPAMMAEIDAALPAAQLSDADRARVTGLREKGEELHEAGRSCRLGSRARRGNGDPGPLTPRPGAGSGINPAAMSTGGVGRRRGGPPKEGWWEGGICRQVAFLEGSSEQEPEMIDLLLVCRIG
jgi:hypothetical protein